MTLFRNYIGIDYSGAQTPTASLKGLRIYAAQGDQKPKEMMPPPSPRRYWTRREVADWLCEYLKKSNSVIVGIDHGFSFPVEYFKQHHLSGNWDEFLDDFCVHWPTDQDHTYVDFVLSGMDGNGAARMGNPRWRRLTEKRTRTATSVFRYHGQGSVGKSTHAGLPWLRYIRQKLGDRVHFWPFDGWHPTDGTHVIAEVYPALWKHIYPIDNRTPDQQDAFAVCSWLQETDQKNDLKRWFNPSLSKDDHRVASIEGWILGVG